MTKPGLQLQQGFAITSTLIFTALLLGAAALVPLANYLDNQNADIRSGAINNCCNTDGYKNCSSDQDWTDGYYACLAGACTACEGTSGVSCDNDGCCEPGEDESHCQQDCIKNSSGVVVDKNPSACTSSGGGGGGGGGGGTYDTCSADSANGCQNLKPGYYLYNNYCLECFFNSNDGKCGRDLVSKSLCGSSSPNPTTQPTPTPPPGTTCIYSDYCGGCINDYRCLQYSNGTTQTCNQVIDQECQQTGCCGDGVYCQTGQTCCSGLQLCSNSRCGTSCIDPTDPVCGDGVCEVGENSTNCSQDCSQTNNNDGVPGNLTNCTDSCADPDNCVCQASNCVTAQGKQVIQGYSCGSKSNTDGIKAALNNCTDSCLDPDGCICNSYDCVTTKGNTVIQGYTCGSKSTKDNVKGNLYNCTSTCTDPDGCLCQYNTSQYQCQVSKGNAVAQGDNCGGTPVTDNKKGQLFDCNTSCTDPDGCTCQSTSCAISQGSTVLMGYDCGATSCPNQDKCSPGTTRCRPGTEHSLESCQQISSTSQCPAYYDWRPLQTCSDACVTDTSGKSKCKEDVCKNYTDACRLNSFQCSLAGNIQTCRQQTTQVNGVSCTHNAWSLSQTCTYGCETNSSNQPVCDTSPQQACSGTTLGYCDNPDEECRKNNSGYYECQLPNISTPTTCVIFDSGQCLTTANPICTNPSAKTYSTTAFCKADNFCAMLVNNSCVETPKSNCDTSSSNYFPSLSICESTKPQVQDIQCWIPKPSTQTCSLQTLNNQNGTCNQQGGFDNTDTGKQACQSSFSLLSCSSLFDKSISCSCFADFQCDNGEGLSCISGTCNTACGDGFCAADYGEIASCPADCPGTPIITSDCSGFDRDAGCSCTPFLGMCQEADNLTCDRQTRTCKYTQSHQDACQNKCTNPGDSQCSNNTALQECQIVHNSEFDCDYYDWKNVTTCDNGCAKITDQNSTCSLISPTLPCGSNIIGYCDDPQESCSQNDLGFYQCQPDSMSLLQSCNIFDKDLQICLTTTNPDKCQNPNVTIYFDLNTCFEDNFSSSDLELLTARIKLTGEVLLEELSKCNNYTGTGRQHCIEALTNYTQTSLAQFTQYCHQFTDPTSCDQALIEYQNIINTIQEALDTHFTDPDDCHDKDESQCSQAPTCYPIYINSAANKQFASCITEQEAQDYNLLDPAITCWIPDSSTQNCSLKTFKDADNCASQGGYEFSDQGKQACQKLFTLNSCSSLFSKGSTCSCFASLQCDSADKLTCQSGSCLPTCGDNYCSSSESEASCPLDCSPTNPPPPTCTGSNRDDGCSCGKFLGIDLGQCADDLVCKGGIFSGTCTNPNPPQQLSCSDPFGQHPHDSTWYGACGGDNNFTSSPACNPNNPDQYGSQTQYQCTNGTITPISCSPMDSCQQVGKSCDAECRNYLNNNLIQDLNQCINTCGAIALDPGSYSSCNREALLTLTCDYGELALCQDGQVSCNNPTNPPIIETPQTVCCQYLGLDDGTGDRDITYNFMSPNQCQQYEGSISNDEALCQPTPPFGEPDLNKCSTDSLTPNPCIGVEPNSYHLLKEGNTATCFYCYFSNPDIHNHCARNITTLNKCK